jgi:diaminopimelate epimerase
MEIAFLKIQASGNDYICIETDKTPPPEERHLGALAKKICDRRIGVGGEGLLLLSLDEERRIRARIFTPQGVEREECGSALQCAGRYAYDAGIVTDKEFAVHAGERIVKMEIIDSSNIRQDMGTPFTFAEKTELKELLDTTYTKSIVIENHEYSCTPLFLDTVYVVLFVASFSLPLHQLAHKVERHPLFSRGASVAFVRVFSREELQVRAWQEGGGEVLTCPKTAAAGVIAAALNGFAEREALVHLRGGDLFIEWDEITNHVFYTGPSEYVFSGNYYFDE